MSNALKCPNPSCPYLFDPSRVPAGVVLSCPRCGQRFTLGGSSSASGTHPGTEGPNAPGGYPSAPAPSEIAGFGFENMAGPSAAADSEPAGRQQAIARPLPGQSEGGKGSLVLVIIVSVALLAGTALTVYFTFIKKKKSGDGGDMAEIPVTNMNVVFKPPAAPWTQDDAVKRRIGDPINVAAYKRADPEAFMAFGARDFENREPRPIELERAIKTPLARMFNSQSIQLNPPSGTWLAPKATKMVGYRFRAQTAADGPVVEGEVYAAAYKGIAYYAICWAGEGDYDKVRGEFDAVRDGFKLREEREKWVPTRKTGVDYSGTAGGYKLTDEDKGWVEEKQEEPPPLEKGKDDPKPKEEPKPDLKLSAASGAFFADGRPRPDPNVGLEVWVVAGNGELPAAVEFVKALRVKELEMLEVPAGTVSFEDRADPVENLEDPPEGSANVVRLRSTVKGQKQMTRLIVISTIPLPEGKMAVLYAWSPIDGQYPVSVWEPKLVRIARTLRPK